VNEKTAKILRRWVLKSVPSANPKKPTTDELSRRLALHRKERDDLARMTARERGRRLSTMKTTAARAA